MLIGEMSKLQSIKAVPTQSIVGSAELNFIDVRGSGKAEKSTLSRFEFFNPAASCGDIDLASCLHKLIS